MNRPWVSIFRSGGAQLPVRAMKALIDVVREISWPNTMNAHPVLALGSIAAHHQSDLAVGRHHTRWGGSNPATTFEEKYSIRA